YLFAQGDGAQTSIYVCLFKRSHGRPLIAVKSHAADTDEITHLNFFEYKHGRLVEINEAVLPVKVNEEFKYKMPRYDRSIEVSDKRGRKIYSFLWTGRKIRVEETKGTIIDEKSFNLTLNRTIAISSRSRRSNLVSSLQ